MIAKRITLSLLIGCAITSVPWLVNKLDNEALSLVNFLDAPGILVAMVISGNVHNIIGGLPVIYAANVLCYALAISFWLRPKRKSGSN